MNDELKAAIKRLRNIDWGEPDEISRDIMAVCRAAERGDELREGDNKLIRALAEDAGIKITAPDNMLGLQWEQFHDGVIKLVRGVAVFFQKT